MKKLLSLVIISLSVFGSAMTVQASAVLCDTTLIRAAVYGKRGAAVSALQKCLISHGYSIRGGATGYYGPNTAAAVKAFYKAELNISNWNGRSVGPRARSIIASNAITTPVSVSHSQSDLKRISSEAELKEYLKSTDVSYYNKFGSSLRSFETDSVSVAAPVAVNAIQSGSTPDRVSTTNVQVEGIDEPDIVKTDGTTIYFSREQNNYTGSVCPPNARCAEFAPSPQETKSGVTAIIAFPLASVGVASDSIPERGEMLLVKDKKVLVIMTYNQIVGYDISNPAKPVKKWTNDLKNSTQITTARLKDNLIYLVTSTYLNSNSPCPIVPMVRGATSVSIPCGNIWAPRTVESSDTTYTVFTLDPMTGVEKNALTYLGDSSGTTVSMFENNMYIANRIQSSVGLVMLDFYSTQLDSFVTAGTRSRIAEIVTYNISDQSKINEINQAVDIEFRDKSESERLKLQTEIGNRMTEYMSQRQRETDRTIISRIALADLSITATGSVPGHLLNQFAMDEYNNNLRVATTVGETWNGKSANDVYVLDRSMKIIGSLTDLGLTERIYSVRFIGSRAYVVTFRQTDPFYVIDLSTPTKPLMMGELKIPGYSAYLEPLSDSLVLGVGREGGQVKLSLFDVSNPRNPVEKSKYMLDEYWTEVENNHHAFLRDAKHSVFFIPGGKGGYIVSYANSTLSLQSTVAVDQVKRALFIDDLLYIVAQNLITVLDENSWKEVKTLKLN